MQEEVGDFREKGFYYCIPSLYVYISVVLLFYSHKMKRTLFASAVAVAMLWITVSFAQSPLTEQFTTLSEQIIEQSARPFDKLEELKALFTSCAEKHNSPEVKAACAEWLASSYPKIKAATPQQIYVELGSDDVEVKKIGEKRHYDGEGINGTVYSTGDLYEIRIPKYWFRLQFPLMKGQAPQKALNEWQWAQSGMITIPSYWLGTKHSLAHVIDEQFALFNFPYFQNKSSLVEVGKVYRKLYEDIFCLKDWKGLEEKKRPHWKEKANRFTEYIIGEWALPLLEKRELWGSWFYGASAGLYFYYGSWVQEQYKESLAQGRVPKNAKTCKILQEQKRGNNKWYVNLFWNKYTPKYFWIWMHWSLGTDNIIFDK